MTTKIKHNYKELFRVNENEFKTIVENQFPSKTRKQKIRSTFAGYEFNIDRVLKFETIGRKCIHCEILGTYWKLGEGADKGLHFDLYGTNDNNEEVMLTLDHIHPKSKGGPNHITNYQCLCFLCNSIKKDNLETNTI